MRKILLFSLVFVLTGCSSVGIESEVPFDSSAISSQYYDPSITAACGEFELREDRQYGSNGYYLCANEAGECEYKVTYFVAAEGCDYDEDKFPYGDPECDEVNVKRISEAGEVLYDGPPSENEYFNCSSVMQQSFNDKVGAKF